MGHTHYSYIGPEEHITRISSSSDAERVRVYSGGDVKKWISSTRQQLPSSNSITATYVVDTAGDLWISDRRTEHIFCSGGQSVSAAGEITFDLSGGQVEVVGLSNQSTGFCPEPISWGAVQKALKKASISHPDDFTEIYHFRRCSECAQINIVKNDIFECAVCGSPLSKEWNINT